MVIKNPGLANSTKKKEEKTEGIVDGRDTASVGQKMTTGKAENYGN